MKKLKNILLIITDTFRYDNLGGKAEKPINTPELDKFAKKKALSIENFYAGSFPTIPHRTDLATGRVGWPNYPWQSIQKSSQNHIAEILKKSGYITQLICDCPHLFPANFNKAFDAAYQIRGQEGDRHLLHLNDPIEKIMPEGKNRTGQKFKGHSLADQHRWINRYYKCEEDTFPAKTSKIAIRWLEENYKSEDPIFIWVDFFDPHEPWDPPEYLVKLYDPNYDGIPIINPNYGHSSAYNEEELKNLWAHYAAESELVDRWIGRVLKKVEDLQLWENTFVIITSDHGISIGEHKRTGKSNESEKDDRYWPLYPEISHIPFLISGPGIKKGRKIEVISQPIDILPTLKDLAGFHLKCKEKIEGNSLSKVLTGEVLEHRKYAVSGKNLKYENEKCATTPFLVTKKWGYVPVGSKGNRELYNIQKDTLAEKNVAKENKDIVRKLQDKLISYLKNKKAPRDFLSLWK